MEYNKSAKKVNEAYDKVMDFYNGLTEKMEQHEFQMFNESISLPINSVTMDLRGIPCSLSKLEIVFYNYERFLHNKITGLEFKKFLLEDGFAPSASLNALALMKLLTEMTEGESIDEQTIQ